ncbi:hypothetical protein DL770_000558 [Monosporascus sp. CRB-9-2]|nr:hypothetical protein DL770_000558 [Monosporascus sp. CRB-9-2]
MADDGDSPGPSDDYIDKRSFVVNFSGFGHDAIHSHKHRRHFENCVFSSTKPTANSFGQCGYFAATAINRFRSSGVGASKFAYETWRHRRWRSRWACSCLRHYSRGGIPKAESTKAWK